MEERETVCKYALLKKAKKDLGISGSNYFSISMFLDSCDEYARLSGRRSAVIVASAIYLYCKETQKISQKSIAESLGICEVSIRNTMRVLVNYMPEEKRPELDSAYEKYIEA